MTFNSNNRFLDINLLNLHPLPVGGLIGPEGVQLLVGGGRGHGNDQGEEGKHFGASSKGNDGARDALNLKYLKFEAKNSVGVRCWR